MVKERNADYIRLPKTSIHKCTVTIPRMYAFVDQNVHTVLVYLMKRGGYVLAQTIPYVPYNLCIFANSSQFADRGLQPIN